MSDTRIKKRSAATSDRLETSKPVQTALTTVGDKPGLAFLKAPAGVVIATLEVIQNIDNGDTSINTELANLALDSCALVYIVIDQCTSHVGRHTNIAREMELDAEELTTFLKQIRAFIKKVTSAKITRRLDPRIRKKDEKEIATSKQELRRWGLKFGCLAQHSLHETLENVMNSKLNAESGGDIAHMTQESIISIQTVDSLSAKAHNMSLRDNQASTSTYSQNNSHPMPEPVVQEHSPYRDEQIPKDPAFAWPISQDTVAALIRFESEKTISAKERETERNKKKQIQIAAMEFNSLPELSIIPDDDYKTQRNLFASTKRTSVVDNDEAIAQELHKQLQAELDLEDEQGAIYAAATIQREIEAEEAQNEATGSSAKKKKKKKSAPIPTDSSNMTPNVNLSSNDDNVNRARPNPSPYQAHGYNGSPVSHQSYGSLLFGNLQNSGVSIGGGPVNVYNEGSGNTYNNVVRDSFNSYGNVTFNR